MLDQDIFMVSELLRALKPKFDTPDKGAAMKNALLKLRAQTLRLVDDTVPTRGAITLHLALQMLEHPNQGNWGWMDALILPIEVTT